MEKAFGAHAFGEAVDDAVADFAGGLGGYVARRDACAPGGDDEMAGSGVAAKGGDDEVEVVGESFGDEDGGTCFGEGLGDGGAGEIDLSALEAAIADGEDGDAGVGRKRRRHKEQGTRCEA